MEHPISEFKLCYIEGGFAYFTTANLTEQHNGRPTQWGDDWNDRPYEHNAGRPSSIEGEEIAVVHFTLEGYDEPCDKGNWSVQEINAHQYAWLQPEVLTLNSTVIYACDTIEEFVEKVESAGGVIWINRQNLPHHIGITGVYGG